MDNVHGQRLFGTLQTLEGSKRIVTYGRDSGNDVCATDVSVDVSGIRGTIVLPGGAVALRSRLVGEYNIENILCSAAIAVALGLPLSAVEQGIIAMATVPGRLERVDDKGRMVFVDYAHTPDALENVLRTLRGITPRRLICVFGCGGDRDRGKRPLMGKIAGRLCDLAVVTSDNPRTETPGDIIVEIVTRVKQEMSREFSMGETGRWMEDGGFMVIPDRAGAIQEAMGWAAAGDVVLIAGKGHETYQIIGREKRDFDDRRVAAEALRNTFENSSYTWTGADILAATGGRHVCGELSCRFSGIGIDSRVIAPTALFVAIVGKIHDGHGFCLQVAAAGGRGFLVDKDAIERLPVDTWRRQSVFCVAVSDTTRALGDLAAWYRKRHSVKVVAITGSCGKTTTRDMTASVLRQRYATLSPKKNYNNEIGLPLTLLDLSPWHEWAVVELGMNHLGEIARLGEICRPDIGVITNVGAAHLEGLGTVDNVASAKAELIPTIRQGGTTVLNADDIRVRNMAQQVEGRILFFGESESADIRSRNVNPSGSGTAFELVLPKEKMPIFLRGPGLFMASNALAAAAVGYVAGLSPEEIKTGLEAFQPMPGRMNLVETTSGLHILDDTYNANPVSMTAAISTLTSRRGEGRAMAVLGDMFELGARSKEFHHALGIVTAQSGVVRVYATGKFADDVAAGASEAFMKTEDVMVGSKADILADLKKRIVPGDWVLVKGSRAAEMDKIVSELVAWAGGIRRTGDGIKVEPDNSGRAGRTGHSRSVGAKGLSGRRANGQTL